MSESPSPTPSTQELVGDAASRPAVVNTVADLREAIAAVRATDATIGLVPTMGALHRGHLSLVQRSRQRCDATVVTIFVNPTQFAFEEDLDKYPRPLQQDLRLLAEEGVDLVFVPDEAEVYPEGFTTSINPPQVARMLEGESRPTHFAGVATVVLKLFNMVNADVAFFGQKDYQQSLVVRHLVADLNVPIEIDVCPIVRDEDGLALSSRNVYLSAEERKAALSLNRTLAEAASLIRQGENDGRVLAAQMTQSLIEGGVTELEYAVVADAETLQVQEMVHLPVVLLVAARVGTTRLIDNVLIREA
ncbi:MAG: pantoate--beta-alanine ligase [Pirellulaceae bacterium]